MSFPVQIVFKGIPHSDAVESRLRSKAEKLNKHCSDIKRCRVVVDVHHHNNVNIYDINIDISVPDQEIVVNQTHHNRQEHEDIYSSIKHAFSAAERQLEDYSRIHRGDVKSHISHSRSSREKRTINEDNG